MTTICFNFLNTIIFINTQLFINYQINNTYILLILYGYNNIYSNTNNNYVDEIQQFDGSIYSDILLYKTIMSFHDSLENYLKQRNMNRFDELNSINISKNRPVSPLQISRAYSRGGGLS